MRLRGALALAFCFAWAAGAAAQTSGNKQSNPLFSSRTLLGTGNGQMLLRADHVDYDLNTSVTTAEGHVEIDYNGRILLADRIIYDKNRDSVTAESFSFFSSLPFLRPSYSAWFRRYRPRASA